MVDYVKLAATANRLVTKSGKSITVRKLNSAPADPTKPWRGAVDPRSPAADTQVVAAVEVAESGIGKLINKKDIPDTVDKFYIAAPGLSTPDLDDFDEVNDGGVDARIVLMKALRPAGTVLIYVIGTCK